ncbi:MAG: cyclic nucleotide-binding domain-containing protein [Myxococcaceae bacterium]
MTQFLQSNVTLLVGAVMVVALLAIRAASSDHAVRKDLRGAIYYLTAFLALRSGGYWLESHISPELAKAFRVAWMLTFAFGSIRAFVALVLWGLRLRKAIPKILRDVIDLALYATAAVPILKSQLDIDLTGLLATSAILSLVLGLALQDTLGNLFAGLALQLERPFQVGDFVTVGAHTGRVVHLAWRSTRIETFRREVVTLPNNVVAKEAVLNFSNAQAVAHELTFDAAYAAPPNLVRSVALQVLAEIPLLLKSPAPFVRVQSFQDSGIRYQVRFWVADFAEGDPVRDEVFSRLWYRLGREGIELPFPQRTLHLVSDEPRDDVSGLRQELIAQVDLFKVLSGEERERLNRELSARRFGRGERVITEGEEGHTFYLVASGEVSVRTGKAEAEVVRLGRGQYFGEMSLLTGEPRAATVVALDDALLLELDRPSFARLFERNPGLGKKLSALLAQRRSELKAVAAASGAPADSNPEEGRIFGRLRQIFGLRDD